MREGEHAGHEILAQHRIFEAAALLYRQFRPRLYDFGSEHAAPVAVRWIVRLRVHLHAIQAAGRRVLHEDVAADVGERRHDVARISLQAIGHVDFRILYAAHSRRRHVAHQADRFARHAHADRHFRTYASKREQTRELFVAQRGTFVAAVVADFGTGQAVADGDDEGWRGSVWQQIMQRRNPKARRRRRPRFVGRCVAANSSRGRTRRATRAAGA